MLAKFIEKHQETFRGLRVCELGAGCGLVSVAMLHAGASRVVATDLESNTPLLFSNVSRKPPRGAEVGKDWDVKALTWGADAAEALDYEPFDLVVATDCMYVPESATALADTLEALVFGGLTKRRRDENGLTKTSRAPFGARFCSRTAGTDKPSQRSRRLASRRAERFGSCRATCRRRSWTNCTSARTCASCGTAPRRRTDFLQKRTALRIPIYTTDHVVDEKIIEPRITHACVSVRRLSDSPTRASFARARSRTSRALFFHSFSLA